VITEPAKGRAPTVRFAQTGDVTVITLDRPERLNAVNDALVRDLCDVLARAGDELPAVVVLTGAGRAFCAGHDLKEAPEEEDDAAALARLDRLAEVTRRVRQLSMPVVAAVRGYALGAGFEFALCCDLVIAHPDTVFGFPEVEVGLAVTGGLTHLLPLMVGPAKANELVFMGAHLDAHEAAALGLVNLVAEDPLARALDWADVLAAKPRRALALAKSCLAAGLTGGLGQAFALETAASLALAMTPDAQGAARAFRARHGGTEPA
jgi:2-(1,2-epoxy-1,2-dihydrophenyl)acetyl-CoA isomerase